MKKEHLPGKVHVKGTMLHAHLNWLETKTGKGKAAAAVSPLLQGDDLAVVVPGVLANAWITLKSLVAVDRAIASAAKMTGDTVFRELGRYSATSNLAGVYKSFVAGEPHKFFEKQARLHSLFQDFGRSEYEVKGPREGRLRLHDYVEFSPVFCGSATGYYEGALQTMKAPGPVIVREIRCACSGDPVCEFEIRF